MALVNSDNESVMGLTFMLIFLYFQCVENLKNNGRPLLTMNGKCVWIHGNYDCYLLPGLDRSRKL